MAWRRMNIWNVILVLAAYRNGRLYPCGTAFLVGRSLALTAWHVVDQPFDRADYDSRNLDFPDYGMVALQQVKNSEEALCWRVKSAHSFPVPSSDDRDDRSIDVSLLQLLPFPPTIPAHEEFRRWFVEINVAPPPLGSRVKAYGFAESRIEQGLDPASFICNKARVKVEGEVTQVFFPHRDRGFLPFPCFEVSSDFVPGMSGGPIFNQYDQVCGIVTSGGIQGVSYGAVLWPVLGVEYDGRRLFDLARQGSIRVVNHHCVTIHESNDSRFPGMSFDPNRVIQS